MTQILRCRADFAVRTDAAGKEVLETSKSSILMPKTRWNRRGIKWLDDKKAVKGEAR